MLNILGLSKDKGKVDKEQEKIKDSLKGDDLVEVNESDEVKNLEDFLSDDNMIRSVYPFSWEELPDHIESGSNYIRVIAITAYPKTKYGNWLSELKRKKGNITIINHFESNDSELMMNYYNTAIKNKETELLKTYDPLKQKRLQKEIDTANRQLDKYNDNEANYIYQSMYVYLTANSLEELDTLTDSVTNTLRKQQLRTINPIKAQYHAFWSALPLNENLLREYTYQQSNTDVASSIFPFDDSEILNLSPRSDIEGINKDTDSLIAVDYTDKRNILNQNMVVIGTSGVGKTTYMSQKLMKDIAKGTKVFIIDPENEYTDIVNKYGGEVVHLSSNARTKINPLEIFTETVFDDDSEDDNSTNVRSAVDMETLVRNKVQRVKSFFEILKPNLTAVEKSILDRVLRDVYRNSGVLKYSTIHEVTHEQWPILADVYEQISNMERSEEDKKRYERIEDFYFILDSYVNGSNTLFNGHTNINIDTDLISFDLQALQNEPESQAGAYLNTFSYLWDEITKNKSEHIKLYVDEFHFLTQNPNASRFFYQAYKRFRKYNAGAIAGTQQIQDVLDGTMESGRNIGEAIIGNSFTKVFFGLDKNGLDDIQEKLEMNFSEKEMRELSQKKQGQALLINGSKRALMKVELTQEELRNLDINQYAMKYHNYTRKQVDNKSDKELSQELQSPNYHERIEMTPIEEEEALSFQY